MKIIIYGATRSGFSDFRLMGVPVACCEEMGNLPLGLVPLLQQGKYTQEDVFAIFDGRPSVAGTVFKALSATYLPKKVVFVTDTPAALRSSVRVPEHLKDLVVITSDPADVGKAV